MQMSNVYQCVIDEKKRGTTKGGQRVAGGKILGN